MYFKKYKLDRLKMYILKVCLIHSYGKSKIIANITNHCKSHEKHYKVDTTCYRKRKKTYNTAITFV